MSLDRCKVEPLENDRTENTLYIKQEPEVVDKIIDFEFIGVDCENPGGLDSEEHSTKKGTEGSYPLTIEDQIPTYIITNTPTSFNNITFIPQKDFTCFKCGFGTDVTSEFKLHLWRHRHEMSFRCSVCNVTFKWMVDFRNHTTSHEKKHETRDQMFGCLYCQYKSKVKSEVAEHSLLGHPEEISLKCDICNLHVKSKREFEMHVKTHHKFTCKCCQMTFLKKVNYDLHVKLHAKKRKISHRDDSHEVIVKQQVKSPGELNVDNGARFITKYIKVEVEDTAVSYTCD